MLMGAADLSVSDADLDLLDAYLLSDQSPPECMMLSDLDGFLTAVAIGPELVMPSEWLPHGMHSVSAALLGLGWGEIDTGLLEGPGSCLCLDRRPSRTRWWPARGGPGRRGRSAPLLMKRNGPRARSLPWRAGTGLLRAFCSGGGVNSGRRSSPPPPHPRRPLSRWCCLLPSRRHAHPRRAAAVWSRWNGPADGCGLRVPLI